MSCKKYQKVIKNLKTPLQFANFFTPTIYLAPFKRNDFQLTFTNRIGNGLHTNTFLQILCQACVYVCMFG